MIRAGVAVETEKDSAKGVKCSSCARSKKKVDGLSCGDIVAKAIETEYNYRKGKKNTKKVEKNTKKAKKNEGNIKDIKEEHIETIKELEEQEHREQIFSKCPECGAELSFTGGCNVCPSCGFSKCN